MKTNGPVDSFDISFMPSHKCDLHCPFCMYDCGPDKDDLLDVDAALAWVEKFPYPINSFGIYGGEPTLFLGLVGRLLMHLPKAPRWMITNGAWSQYENRTLDVVAFAELHDLKVIVSGNPVQMNYQSRWRLNRLSSRFELKEPDGMIPMGRQPGEVKCTQVCMNRDQPARICVRPDGSIMWQSCDGGYPIIGTIHEPFVGCMNTRRCYFSKPAYPRK